MPPISTKSPLRLSPCACRMDDARAHLVALHLLPRMTGQPLCRLSVSSVPLGVWL